MANPMLGIAVIVALIVLGLISYIKESVNNIVAYIFGAATFIWIIMYFFVL
jgi:hypothetical protein